MKSATAHMIASFQGMPPAHLLRSILDLEEQQAEINRKLAAARKAQKNQRKANGKQADRAKA